VLRFASLGFLAGLWLVLAGCSTMNLAQAEIQLPSPLDEACLEAGVRAERDVINFRRFPEATGPAWWFELADPDLVSKDVPSLLLTTGETGGQRYVQLAANFSTSGSSKGANLRKAMVEREQAMLQRVVEQCSGARVAFGEPRMCGKNETHTLCAEGRLVPRQAADESR